MSLIALGRLTRIKLRDLVPVALIASGVCTHEDAFTASFLIRCSTMLLIHSCGLALQFVRAVSQPLLIVVREGNAPSLILGISAHALLCAGGLSLPISLCVGERVCLIPLPVALNL